MSSQPPNIPSKAVATSSKAPSASSQSSPATNSQTQQFFSNDLGQRRNGGNSGSGGNARSQQSNKPKHKHGKKFRALDEDAEAEMYSMQNPHGRKGQTSITHLMNFSLPPRPGYQQHQFHRHSYNGPPRRGHGGRINPTWGLGSGYHAVDKARYIHANYRFIVDPRGDYHVQAEDADVHLDWNNVLQIVASSKTQAASCPICLGDPTAPRMAKCGHMFCLPCLIRYMHAEDASNNNGPHPAAEKKARWKKCPICWDSIYISETRPVRWYVGQENDTPPHEGSDVVLRLVRRRPGQTLAMPRESAETVPKGEDIPWYFAAEVMDYARVMKGSEEYMIQQYDKALDAIEQLQREDELMFGEDAEWTSRAARTLREAKEKISGMGNAPELLTRPEDNTAPLPERPPIEFNEGEEGIPDMYLQKHANDATPSSPPATSTTAVSNVGEQKSSDTVKQANSELASVPRTLRELRHRQMGEKPQPAEYLFYQALPHYYLSPLDIRILKAAFGTYNNFPSSILPSVERVSAGHVVDDELKRRCKYLSHVPYGCEVAFLECDWKDVVPERVMQEFGPVLDRRRRRYEERIAAEEKERVRIERAEERELAAVRRANRPRGLNDEDAIFSASTDALPVLGADSVTAASSSPPAPSWPPQRSISAGFATLASPSTSPNVSKRTVWGTAAVAPVSPDLHAALPRDDEFRAANEVDDGWLQGWEKDLLDQGDQLSLDMGGVSLNSLDGGTQQPSKGTGGVGGKKAKGKNKGKKITLMSTATARRGA